MLPGRRVGRACRVLEVLARHSHPRVQAVMLRSWTSGWCTKSRFQQCGSCRFGCGAAQDSIEHFAHCRVVNKLIARTLHADGQSRPPSLDDFLCMNLHLSEAETVNRCVVVYATYRLYNQLRAGGSVSSDLDGAFRQHVAFATSFR